MKGLLALCTGAVVAAGTGAACADGERARVSGLVCTEPEPLMAMIDVAENQSSRIARAYMNEDLPRLPQCGTLAQPVAVSAVASLGSFDLGDDGYRIVRVTVDETGATLFLLTRDVDTPAFETGTGMPAVDARAPRAGMARAGSGGGGGRPD